MSGPLEQFVTTCRALAVEQRPTAAIADAMKALVADPATLAAQIPVPTDGPNASASGIDEILFEDDTVTIFLVHARAGVERRRTIIGSRR